MTHSLFVSQHGDDLNNNCGNQTMPCRTVRHAVKMSRDGDEIFINYVHGKPYMECENATQSSCAVELTKSVSFYGINGKAEIQCRKCPRLFIITSPGFNITRINFFNLIISKTNTVVELGAKTNTELVFQNMLLMDNLAALYSKHSTACSIKIFNSSFEHHIKVYWGIHLRCANLTVHINSSFFAFTPLLLTNVANEPTSWRKIEILIQHTVFNDENIQKCSPVLEIKPFAAICNVTIIDSHFKNHFSDCSSRRENHISTVLIFDGRLDVRNITFILLRNLIFENNYNDWGSLSLYAGYQNHATIVIKNCIFRNNSVAIRVSTHGATKHSQLRKSPAVIIDNNTFVENFYDKSKVNGAAAIHFFTGRSRVLSCRFINNRPGLNPYTGVVTISKARVTFCNCYFENRQTTERANQLFASGNQPVYFRDENTFNLVALKGSQTVFSRVPIIFNTGVIMKKNFKIICPQGYKVNSQRECKIIKNAYMCYYINVQCEQCPTKTYTLERGDFIFNKSNDIQCQKCPRGGDCDSGLVKGKPNFWGFKATTKVNFVQCPPGYCCNDEDCITYNGCHGNRSGILCGQCSEGNSESLFSTQCIANKECFFNYFFIFGTIALLTLYLVFFLYHKKIVNILTSLFSKQLSFLNSRNGQRNNTFARSGMIKIFFYYYQVNHLLRSSVGSPKNGSIIHNFENVISRVMNIVLLNLPSFNCPLKDLRAVPKAVLVHSLGYVLLCVLCLLYLISKLCNILKKCSRNDRETALQNITIRPGHRRNISKSSFSQRVASAFTYISLLMYASSAQLCLSLLHCVPVDDHQVLFLDGNIKCYQTFQYFVLAYMISSILPFCLVPVLGSYLLKFDRIGVKQFCAACIFPLPFCSFWLYLLIKDYRCGNQATYNILVESDNALRSEQSNNEDSLGDEDIIIACTYNNDTASKSVEFAILKILLGPFRPHQTFMCFPSLYIPWEGFLIFRRLVLIIVLTFVYDIQLKLFLALTVCVAILNLHMLVKPFQRKLDNVLETLSLSTHVILCGLTLVKSLYYGEDYSSFSKCLPALNVIEIVLVVGPLSIIMVVVIFSIVIKFISGLKLCLSVLTRNVRRLI